MFNTYLKTNKNYKLINTCKIISICLKLSNIAQVKIKDKIPKPLHKANLKKKLKKLFPSKINQSSCTR